MPQGARTRSLSTPTPQPRRARRAADIPDRWAPAQGQMPMWFWGIAAMMMSIAALLIMSANGVP